MRVFHPKMQKLPKEWADKVNFVDENNVVLGYDSDQNCCEFWTWNIDRKAGAETLTDETGGYHIDPNFREQYYVFDINFYDEIKNGSEENPDAAIFKVVNKNDPNDIYYVNLWNCHNGYYSHGFSLTENDKVIKEGYI